VKRRSFLSLAGITPLLPMRLWSQVDPGMSLQEWGAPCLSNARAEHERVVLSFGAVKGATSYAVRYHAAGASPDTIEGILVTHYSVQGLKNGTTYSFSVSATGPNGATPYSNQLSATPAEEPDWGSLSEAFQGSNPTRTSCPFWMIRGNETDDDLRKYLEVIQKFGFEGVTLHPYDFKGFLEGNNWHQWRVIVEHARKLGLVVWEQDDKDYPCGYAAGKVVAMNRDFGRWEVTLVRQTRHHGPKSLALNLSEVLPAKQRIIAIVAAGPNDQFEDLTDRVSGNQLRWEVPGGDWEVFVHGAWQPGLDDPRAYPDLVRGEIRGYIDPLSPEATEMLVKLVLEDTCKAIGEENVGRTWKGFYIDEPGFYSSGITLGTPGAGYPYTPSLFPRFEKRYGYSLRPLLPLLWAEHGSRTAQVRYDYLDFVSSEYARLFIGRQTRYAEAHHIQINGHVREDLPYQLGGGTGSNFRTLEAFSMGGFDHIFDQWYEPDEDVYWRQPKMASSISHYLQTPADEAMVEHFAATGWRTGLTEMKTMMDWTTCRGLSRIVPCGLDTADPPCWEDAPEFWLHGRNPLAPYFHAYQVIANRGTMLIRGGRHVARSIVLDTAESRWAGEGEDLWKTTRALSQAHFDYDIVSYGVFTDSSRCRIEGNHVRLGREDYQFVFLPGVDAIPRQVTRRLLEFYEAGGSVICLGPELRINWDTTFKHVEYVPHLPLRSAEGRYDGEVKDLVGRIWGDRASGRGHAHLISYKEIADHLYSLDGAHDVWIDPNLTMLQYYHHRLSGREVYFFNNEGEGLSTTVRLHGAEGTPEIWDLVTGSIRQAHLYRQGEGGLSVALHLDRYESAFVVVNPSVKPKAHLVISNADEAVRTESGAIILKKYEPGTFEYSIAESDGRIYDERAATGAGPLATLTLREGWSSTPIEPNGALYKCGFEWPHGEGIGAVLVIEGMSQVISAKLNHEDLGTRFVHPFRFELGSALRPGANELELRHVERYNFKSRLGNIRVAPYYELRV
jgi:hypothetical protein